LSDSSRVAANLSERTYDLYVIRYSAVWPANAKTPLAAQAPGPSPDATAGRGAGIFLPSAASIPPVNIMNTEPALPAEAPARAATSPSPARRPAQSSAPSQPGAGGSATLPTRQPVDLNALRSPAPAYAPQRSNPEDKATPLWPAAPQRLISGAVGVQPGSHGIASHQALRRLRLGQGARGLDPREAQAHARQANRARAPDPHGAQARRRADRRRLALLGDPRGGLLPTAVHRRASLCR